MFKSFNYTFINLTILFDFVKINILNVACLLHLILVKLFYALPTPTPINFVINISSFVFDTSNS